MALSGEQFVIRDGDDEATIVEIGGGLRRYTRGGTDVTVTYGDDELPPKCAGAVLVPWPNRLRGGAYSYDGAHYQLALTEPAQRNAIHGLGRWARWSCIRHDTAVCTMALDIPPQTGWPFEVRVEVTYSVSAAAGLTVAALARNVGTRRAPFGAGFHPYLSLGDRSLPEVSVRIPATHRLVVDSAQIPIGLQDVAGTRYDFRAGKRLRDVRLDDAFTGLAADDGIGRVEVRIGAQGAVVWLDQAFQYAQVFTPDLIAHGQAGIAVEPMTCPADAFNTGAGLIVLEPGTVWTGSWGITPL
ncbi:MAG TPA: aldose 1-epimerase family protein [Jatrophihabitantaceae bacterium]|jgi:aldose 1-epimerase|nr:aldose 1-epimerase family protein [Jatrophihabitantaceae bacterium]